MAKHRPVDLRELSDGSNRDVQLWYRLPHSLSSFFWAAGFAGLFGLINFSMLLAVNFG